MALTIAAPANIQAMVTALNANVAAAQPVEQSGVGTIIALYNQAVGIVNAVDSAIAADASGLLDTWIPPVMAPAIVAGLNSIYTDGGTQVALADLAGFVGRMASNLENGI